MNKFYGLVRQVIPAKRYARRPANLIVGEVSAGSHESHGVAYIDLEQDFGPLYVSRKGLDELIETLQAIRTAIEKTEDTPA